MSMSYPSKDVGLPGCPALNAIKAAAPTPATPPKTGPCRVT